MAKFSNSTLLVRYASAPATPMKPRFDATISS
jgi:hypothetical protein